jgi:hypothetical protein
MEVVHRQISQIHADRNSSAKICAICGSMMLLPTKNGAAHWVAVAVDVESRIESR